MPAAEVDIDEALVRALLREQCADLAGLPLVQVAAGWDNVIFRLGDDFTVRLPRRAVAATLVEHEQRWLPELATRLPLPIPAPVRAGRPGASFRWPWSVCRWLPGDIAARVAPGDASAAAAILGRFLAALHEDAPPDAPVNPYRGIPLEQRTERVVEATEILGDRINRREVLACWSELVTAQPWAKPPVWLHGDLHPANVLVDEGRVSAVIDFGDLTSGDPATDISLAWMLFPRDARRGFREAIGRVDDDTWARARGWALALGLVYVANSADNPLFSDLGERVIDAALAD
jgi:aminoglycoside phosphotransferase (APT) family kinase protein